MSYIRKYTRQHTKKGNGRQPKCPTGAETGSIQTNDLAEKPGMETPDISSRWAASTSDFLSSPLLRFVNDLR